MEVDKKKQKLIIDKYVEDAEDIWLDYRTRKKSDLKFINMSIDDRINYYQRVYNKFALAFPVVLRYMVQLGSYNRKAFRRFVDRLTNNPYRSELEYCERQADYVKFLFMENNKSHSMKEANNVWKKTYDLLVKEVEVFKKANEDAKKNLEENKIRNNIEKRKELKRIIENT